MTRTKPQYPQGYPRYFQGQTLWRSDYPKDEGSLWSPVKKQWVRIGGKFPIVRSAKRGHWLEFPESIAKNLFPEAFPQPLSHRPEVPLGVL